ncbi:MAG: SRPBCC family protein [Syntrophobacteraceae bacterium]|nr:SRPBCC family protein [Syntrophobacteraceae bacterium]
MIFSILSLKAFAQQARGTAPDRERLPADVSANLLDEGINGALYERLVRGEVITRSRPVPPGKSGVHVAVFGLVYGSADKLWDLIKSCGNSPPIMPSVQSCKVIEPNRPLPPNKRWELLKIDFHMLFFRLRTTMVDEQTIETPNFLRWRQIYGDAKDNEGYFRVITINPCTQVVVYDLLVDTGPLVPECIKAWAVKNTLPGIITALRDHI